MAKEQENEIGTTLSADKKAKIEKIKKIASWSFMIFLPILVFFIIPLICRNHFVKTLKISEEVFLSSPQHVNLVSSSGCGPCYHIKINGYTFYVPNKFTPSKIDYNEAEFRIKSRAEGRYIFLHAEKQTKRMKFNSQGITEWFLPSEARRFLPIILNSSWHPFRLMFKAQFFASEGITTKIFKAKWDTNHFGYIFPTAGNEGYLGRIFNKNDVGTVEFLLSDSVKPVTLREWVDLAMKIATPSPAESEYTVKEPELSQNELQRQIEKLTKQAETADLQTKCLELALNEFYKTQNPTWLIPVAAVMQERGFFPDVLDLFRDEIIQNYKKNAPDYYTEMWNEIVDRAVADSIAIEASPHQGLRELSLYCKNLTDLDIKQVKLNIEVLSNLGVIQNFTVTLFNQNSLSNKEEKLVQVRCPAEISLSDAARISHRVESMEFKK